MSLGLKLKKRKLVKVDNGNISQERIFISVYQDVKLSDEELKSLSLDFDIPFSYTIMDKTTENSEEERFITLLLDDLEQHKDKKDVFLLLTADDSKDNIYANSNLKQAKNIFFYVRDFKDGRVFSLIRQIRKINQSADILVGGEFGLDQASYYHSLGASGFVVDDDKVDILLHTLTDLKSAQQGISAHSLPMFR